MFLSMCLLLSFGSAYVAHLLAEPSPSVDMTTLFQQTTQRNHEVITQAVQLVVAMQTAPTCSRMAASHLMNECKVLEHAPEFVKSRPEVYLDNVKTEYAAKLAVCELLSAQPGHPSAPVNCEILVPSAKACSRSEHWWTSRPETSVTNKYCYPEFKERQYNQCLKTLQSSPQYWTSFSNARQNAVVMCQASRDALERENHLETFKNLTKVMGGVSAAMKRSADEYDATIKDHRTFVHELHDKQTELKEAMHAVYEKAVANVGALDLKFHEFMDLSLEKLVTALAQDQSVQIAKIRHDMQVFSVEMLADSSRMMDEFNHRLESTQERILNSLQTNYNAHSESLDSLRETVEDVQSSAVKASIAANSSLGRITMIEERLLNLVTQTDHIANGVAIFNTLPSLLVSLTRRILVAAATLVVFLMLCKLNIKLATYFASAGSVAFLLHECAFYDYLPPIMLLATRHQDASWTSTVGHLSVTQLGALGVVIVWTTAYSINYINMHLVSLISAHITPIVASYWIRQHSNEGGDGFLPSVEIPQVPSSQDGRFTNTCHILPPMH